MANAATVKGRSTHAVRTLTGCDTRVGGKRHIVTFHGSTTDAHKELRRLLKSADDGAHIDHSKVTVAAFLERWERDWAANNVSPKTLERYQGIIVKQIRPNIGDLAAQKLRAVDLNDLYAKLPREGGLKARTVGHVHRLLHRALGHAAAWQVIQQNVASLVSPPKVEDTEIEIIREEEIRTVLQKLRCRSLYPIAAARPGNRYETRRAVRLKVARYRS
jgi:hypothetical protein